MRLPVLAALALFALPIPVLAFDTPRALVEAIYEPYLRHAAHEDLTRFYSERLKGLVEQQVAAPASPAGSEHARDVAGFNPFVAGDSFFPFDFAIAEPNQIGDSAVTTVSYRNFGQPTFLSLSMVREGGDWKIDDIAGLGTQENWLYSWLLTADPYAN